MRGGAFDIDLVKRHAQRMMHARPGLHPQIGPKRAIGPVGPTQGAIGQPLRAGAVGGGQRGDDARQDLGDQALFFEHGPKQVKGRGAGGIVHGAVIVLGSSHQQHPLAGGPRS